MRIRIRTLVFVIGALLMLVPAIVAGAMFTNAMQHRAEVANSARLRLLGEIIASQLGQRMHELWQDVEGMARVVRLEDPEEIRRQFTLLGQVDRRYTWIGVADVQGKVIAASQGMLEGASVAERPWFRRGLNGPAAVDVHEAVLLAKLLPATPEPRRFVDFSAPMLFSSHGTGWFSRARRSFRRPSCPKDRPSPLARAHRSRSGKDGRTARTT
jgi:hypothetical protein